MWLDRHELHRSIATVTFEERGELAYHDVHPSLVDEDALQSFSALHSHTMAQTAGARLTGRLAAP